MKKILIVSELIGGGVEKVNTLIAKNLSDKKYCIKILSIIGRGIDEVNLDIPVINLNFKSGSKAFFKILKVYIKEKADVILVSGSYELYAGILYRKIFNKKSKIIYVQHSVYGMNLKNKSLFQLIIHHKLCIAINIYNKCDKVVFVSKGVKNDLEKYYKIDEEKEIVIYNPVIDINLEVKTKKITNNIIKLITVGRIEIEKNHIHILKALKKLKDKNLNVELTIVGDGSLKNNLIKYCHENDIEKNVKFIGFRKNVYEIIQNKDIFILSSKHESFGNVIIEAMYSGIPVISTDCPCGPREIIGDNEYGYLVQIDDVDELVEKIELIAKRDNSKMINKARKYSEKFTVEKSIFDYEKLIDNL